MSSSQGEDPHTAGAILEIYVVADGKASCMGQPESLHIGTKTLHQDHHQDHWGAFRPQGWWMGKWKCMAWLGLAARREA